MNNKPVSIAITLTVLVILVGALVAPVIAEAIEDNSDVYYNASSALPLDFEKDNFKEHSLEMASGSVSFDDESLALTATLSNLIFADSFRIYGDSSTLYYADNQSFSTKSASVASGALNISLDDGVATVTIGSYSATVPYEWVYVYSESGNYVSAALGTVKVLDVSQVTAEISGDIYYGVVYNGRYTEVLNNGTEPVNNIAWTSTETNGYVTISQINYGSQGVLDSNFPVIVPAKIVVETESSSALGLLVVIPILLIVAALFIAVKATTSRL